MTTMTLHVDGSPLRPSEPTDRTRVRRHAERGVYERETIHAILDEALVCHVGFVTPDGTPVVIPMAHARDGETLILHGAAASRMLKTLARGVEVCVTVTLVDGLVLARTAFSHSMNYRSVVVLGVARPIDDLDRKRRALDRLVEHLVPGRMRDVRPHTEKEIRATTVLALPIDEASAKVRSGAPQDAKEDVDDERNRSVWAGVIPLRLAPVPGVPDPTHVRDVPAPSYVTAYRRPGPYDETERVPDRPGEENG